MTLQDFPARTMMVPRDDYKLHAEVIPADHADAPWIVFGNSLVTDLTIWEAQIAGLAGRYHILRYDQAGHGKSDVPRGPLSFDDLGRDLLAVMDGFGAAQAIYVGLSMGVPTGLAAHRSAPDRFTALVFSDGQAKTAPGGAAGWAERIEMAETSGMDAFASVTAGRWLTETSSSGLRVRLARMIAATPFAGFRACATALMDYDYAAELPRITCPTLLIAGAEDGAMPDGMASKLKPAISDAEMHVIPGAGHVPCFEQPVAFAAILSAFLTSVYGNAAR